MRKILESIVRQSCTNAIERSLMQNLDDTGENLFVSPLVATGSKSQRAVEDCQTIGLTQDV